MNDSSSKNHHLKKEGSHETTTKKTKKQGAAGGASESRSITLKSADDLLVLRQQQEEYSNASSNIRRIEISERFFGPSFISPSWKQRMVLMRQLGSMDTLVALVIKGTIMGHVIPGETLGLAIGKRLQSLTVHAGVIFDDRGSVTTIARALHHHKHLKEIRILNFSNHVLEGNHHHQHHSLGDSNNEQSISLLDPLLMSVTSIPTLRILELTCIASFTYWKQSFVGISSLSSLLVDLPHLQCLNLSNVGLQDSHFEHIVYKMCNPHHSSNSNSNPIQELILNGNRNSNHGLTTILHLLATNNCCSSSLKRLEVVNDVVLSDSNFYLLQHLLEQNTIIEYFACNYYKPPPQIDNNNNATMTVQQGQLPYHQFQQQQQQQQKKKVIDFYLGMNRIINRATYLNPNATLDDCIHILSIVNDNVGYLFYLMKQKPYIFKQINQSINQNQF